MARSLIQKRSRLALPVLLFLATSVYVAATFQINAQFSEGFVGPRFLPILAALIMYAALGRIIWREWRAADDTRREEMSWRPAIIILATGCYIALFKPLGYVLATIAFVYALFAIFEFQVGRPVRRLLYALALTAVFYGLFGLAFGIRLPAVPGVS